MPINALKSSGFSEICSFLLMAFKLFLHEDRLLLAKELNHPEEMGGEVPVGWEMVTQATVTWGGGVKTVEQSCKHSPEWPCVFVNGGWQG